MTDRIIWTLGENKKVREKFLSLIESPDYNQLPKMQVYQEVQSVLSENRRRPITYASCQYTIRKLERVASTMNKRQLV